MLFGSHANSVRPSESPRALYFYTGLGLLLGFGFLVLPVHSPIFAFYGKLTLPWLTIYGLGDATT